MRKTNVNSNAQHAYGTARGVGGVRQTRPSQEKPGGQVAGRVACKILPTMPSSASLADLTTCLTLLMGILGSGTGELTFQVDKALSKALDECLCARRHLRSPRFRSTIPVEEEKEEEPATAVPPVNVNPQSSYLYDGLHDDDGFIDT